MLSQRLHAENRICYNKLLDRITHYLLERGCIRNSIWTFSNMSEASYSSITRDNFLGFGCSATTLLKDQFKINTFSSTRATDEAFEKFFGVPLKRMYGFELWLAKLLGFLTESDGRYEMTLKGAFYYHYYENYYTLAYIDKMWGIMRKEAFPEKISF